MRFGVCTDVSNAAVFAKAGYNFIELNVARDLKPDAPEADFTAAAKMIKALPLPAKTANCFIPGNLKIVGPDVNDERLEQYVHEAFKRSHQAGIKTIVFGSGGARKIPEGFDAKRAHGQLVDFGKMIGPVAKKFSITVAVEPLNTSETNTLNTIAQSLRYVQEVGHSNVMLLVDAYHAARENDGYDEIVAAAPLIVHTHIATYTSRCAPGLEACDFGDFFKALHAGGYTGTLSIEGSWSKLPEQARQTLDILEVAAQG